MHRSRAPRTLCVQRAQPCSVHKYGRHVCVCVCVCVESHRCQSYVNRSQVWIRTCGEQSRCVCVHVCVFVCVSARVCAYVYVCLSVLAYVLAYECVCVYRGPRIWWLLNG